VDETCSDAAWGVWGREGEDMVRVPHIEFSLVLLLVSVWICCASS